MKQHLNSDAIIGAGLDALLPAATAIAPSRSKAAPVAPQPERVVVVPRKHSVPSVPSHRLGATPSVRRVVTLKPVLSSAPVISAVATTLPTRTPFDASDFVFDFDAGERQRVLSMPFA